MPGRSSHRQDPFARINNWDDGFGTAQGPTPGMSGGRGTRRHDDDYRPRRRDPSPQRNYRDESPPPYRSVESHSPPHRSRHDEPVQRRRSTRDAPQSRGYVARSPSPPPRRSERDDRRRHEQQRYRSPSPVDRRRRSPNRYYDRPASPPRQRAPPQAERPGLSRSKTTTGISLSPRWQQAATAAFQAGSLAALTMRSEPGPWTGPKGVKVASAALGAGFMKATGKGDDDKRRSTGGGGSGGGTSRGAGGGGSGGMKSKGVEMLGTALSGFVAQQLAKKAQKGSARY